MHEMSVATALFDQCLAEARTRGADRIERVTVEVGELSGVEPRLLAFAWEALVRGSPHEGAVLALRYLPCEQSCPSCGPVPERQPGSFLRLCPDCGLPLLIDGGDELDLVSAVFSTSPSPEVVR